MPELVAHPTRDLGDRGPAPSPAEAPPVPPPDGGTPTLERPEVDAAFAEHAAATALRWRAVSTILSHSSQPDLQAVSDDLARRLDAAVAESWPAPDRRDLIVEERQLVNFLHQRYRGLAPLEAELDAIEEQVTALDGG